MDQLHTANKVCGGCCAISLNTVDTESSVSPTGYKLMKVESLDQSMMVFTRETTTGQVYDTRVQGNNHWTSR